MSIHIFYLVVADCNSAVDVIDFVTKIYSLSEKMLLLLIEFYFFFAQIAILAYFLAAKSKNDSKQSK
jgi:hypothetical protein